MAESFIEAKTNKLVISVTELVEFCARSGDLYPENAGGPTAQQGVQAHQQLQRLRDDSWQREVALKHQWIRDDWEVTLQGRVDLLQVSDTQVIIEEIKSTLQPAAHLPPGKLALFWAQARVYAGLYQLQNGPIERLELRLSLMNLNRDQVETLHQPLQAADAVAETQVLLEAYLDWCRQVQARRQRNRASAQALKFPFPDYRPGQRALAADIYRTIRSGGALLAEAPTGTGKTVTALFPACKAIGEEQAHQVLYLTAKTTHQRQVEATLASLRAQGLQLDSLTLCARDKLCPCRTGELEPPAPNSPCAYTLGFWDRLPGARQECLATDALDKHALLTIGHRHRVCPSALGLHLTPWSTLVIGDYNYLFDPIAQLNSFTDTSSKTRHSVRANGASRVLLVDELHNLPERARGMYSASLDSRQLKTLAATAGKAVRRLCRQLERWLANLPEGTFSDLPDTLTDKLSELLALLQAEAMAEPGQADLLTEPDIQDEQAGLQIYRFCAIAKHFGDGHRCLVEHRQRNTRIQLICLDPSHALRECHQGQKALIGFSATLSPLEYYRRLLGLDAAALRRLPYPFPADNLLVLRCDYVDTRWQARTHNLDQLAQLLATITAARAGKYLVFFPSYEYLTAGHRAFAAAFPRCRTLCQTAGSSQADQAAFLDGFFKDADPVLGFAILGGLFAEGVDFLGDALHGAIILGTAMPQPGAEQALMAEHFEQHGLNAYQYVYQFPGFMRVMQTAGRVIRSAEDRGVVVLVDPRFARADFRALMPHHWQPRPCGDPQALQQALEEFWRDSIFAMT